MKIRCFLRINRRQNHLFIYSRIDTIKYLYFFLYMSVNQYIIINYQYTLNYFNK